MNEINEKESIGSLASSKITSIEKKIKDCFAKVNSALNIRILIVGGWIRNKLLNLESNDIDVVFQMLDSSHTDAESIQEAVASQLKTQLELKKFRVIMNCIEIQEEVKRFLCGPND